MPFFLEKLGVRLVEFESSPPEIEQPVSEPMPEIHQPKISALGFEVVSSPWASTSAVDYRTDAIRSGVFNSFQRVVLFIQDTKSTLAIALHVNNNSLIVSVPTVNAVCSRLHAEDVEPIDSNTCNHNDIGCDEAHFASGSTLIEIEDYILCEKDEALFRIHNSLLHFLKGKKWIKLNVIVAIADGFYTLNKDNF